MKEALIDYWIKNGIVKNKKLIDAFKKVPREEFVLKEYKDEAYDDNALPIIKGQTISQPTTIMIMLEALELKEGLKVLEIGAGSGYNCALISEIIGKKGISYSVEIIKEVADFARDNIKKLNIKNVQIINADGSEGYKKEAPYDRIIVTAACPKIPEPLIKQLKDDGVLVAPVGKYSQEMNKVKKKDGKLIMENLGSFVFVELKGKYGF